MHFSTIILHIEQQMCAEINRRASYLLAKKQTESFYSEEHEVINSKL